MRSTPLFSVSYLTYNQEDYIAQTLDSILSQKHGYPYEIVVGDDYSNDGTRVIISSYATKYPAIIKPIFNEHNLGVIKNYYNVIANCKGKYIMECGGDDWWLPGKVQTQIDFMESHPGVGMCYGKVENYYKGKKSIAVWPIKENFRDLMTSNSIPALTICMRRELTQKYIDEVNPINKNWLMEDYPMWLWFSHESKIRYLNKILGCYRILEGSISHSGDIEKQAMFLASTEDIKEHFSIKYCYPVQLIKGVERQHCWSYVQSLARLFNHNLADDFRMYYKKSILISNELINDRKLKIYYICARNIILWKALVGSIKIKWMLKKIIK
jgi:glycosyltransferase involved in cell wall biosynthesis